MASTTEPIDLSEITETIAKRYPGLPRSAVEAAVSEAAHTFSDAKVLDFLPVLIEREVQRRLTTAA